MAHSPTPHDSPPRSEYPRPSFARVRWLSLNGWWTLAFDPEDRGLSEHWEGRDGFMRPILVPFAPETPLSGVGDTDFHPIVWYHRSFRVPPDYAGLRLWLHIGAVDYAATVFVNGQRVKDHEGGHVPVSCDITDAVDWDADNALVVRVVDRPRDLTQPRGKQYWERDARDIWYTRTTGIWQPVWLEPVAATALTAVHYTADPATGQVAWTVGVTDAAVAAEARVVIEVGDPEHLSCRVEEAITSDRFTVSAVLPPDHVRLWSPEHPTLLPARYRLTVGGAVVDDVQSYVAFRRLEARGGRLYLNGEPYRLKMVLDQGYFVGGGLTAPSDADLRRDVELVKAMGFNGVRKHQKIEDPRWLYWCDRLGLLVFEEMPDAYAFDERAVSRLVREWLEVLDRDRDHPAIVAWVPVNESWGVPHVADDAAEQAYLTALYWLTKALDPTRLVISNDGWIHTRSDLVTVHDYTRDPAVLEARYADAAAISRLTPEGRPLFASGFAYGGEPVVVSEFGGAHTAAFASAPDPSDAFLQHYRALLRALARSPYLQGYCYTQLADVEQEQNGLLTADRTPKVPLDAVRQLNEAWPDL
jgi:beta-galactosidase/beta-glucuronidase